MDILLGTYNGALYLREQLSSIENQSYKSWRLIVRDDCSTDDTKAILLLFAGRHPGQVILVEDDMGRLGAIGNFRRLLEKSDADYIFFCDQDDIWLPRKIELLLGKILDVERDGEPVLVHSDLEVVDGQMRLLAPSFWRYQAIDPSRSGSGQIAVQNVVTGCAAAFNASLRRAAADIPAEAVMHDWWFALVAASIGKIVFIKEATVRYRQHSRNHTGAKKWGPWYLAKELSRFLFGTEYRNRVASYRGQAAALARLNPPGLGRETRDSLSSFGSLGERPFVIRVLWVIEHGFLKHGLIRNLVFFLSL